MSTGCATIILSQSRLEALCVSTQRAVYLYASPVTVTSMWKQQIGGLLIRGAMKKCIRCGIEKPFKDFVKDNRRENGVGSHCLDCRNEMRREQYAIDPSKINGNVRKWRLAHPEKVKEISRNWASKNVERLRQ